MYVAIEGVIGVGKTTLARLLQPAFNAEIILEVFEENPFLTDFYGDRERYAFQTQIFFLLSRYHQQRRTIHEMVLTGKNLIADYTFAKDALFARINLKGDELDMYYKVHEALAEKIQKPDHRKRPSSCREDEGTHPPPDVRGRHPGRHRQQGHRPRNRQSHGQKRHCQMLRRRYLTQTQTARKTKRRQKANEKSRPRRDSARSVSGSIEGE